MPSRLHGQRKTRTLLVFCRHRLQKSLADWWSVWKVSNDFAHLVTATETALAGVFLNAPATTFTGTFAPKTCDILQPTPVVLKQQEMKREILQEAHGAVWQAGQEGMKGERPE